jgi:hypothetical protein
MAVSFTSEAAAREDERKEPPPELKVQMEEMAALGVGEPEFFDPEQPWLYAPTLRWTRPAWGAGILVGLGEGRRPPNFAPDGPQRPGTPVRTAVGRHLLARRRSPARRAVRPGPDAASPRPTVPQAAAAQMGCPRTWLHTRG